MSRRPRLRTIGIETSHTLNRKEKIGLKLGLGKLKLYEFNFYVIFFQIARKIV